jgi:hypothetical protein
MINGSSFSWPRSGQSSQSLQLASNGKMLERKHKPSYILPDAPSSAQRDHINRNINHAKSMQEIDKTFTNLKYVQVN